MLAFPQAGTLLSSAYYPRRRLAAAIVHLDESARTLQAPRTCQQELHNNATDDRTNLLRAPPRGDRTTVIHLHWTRSTDDGDEQRSDVMFAVDEDGDGESFAIIADVTTDDAWISVPTADARTLSQHR